MESTIGFAAFKASVAHLPDPVQSGNKPRQYPRMSTGGRPPKSIRRFAALAPPRRALQAPAATSPRLGVDYEWPANAIVGKSGSHFKINFCDSWVSPEEWRFWYHEVKRSHCKDRKGHRYVSWKDTWQPQHQVSDSLKAKWERDLAAVAAARILVVQSARLVSPEL
ncbi:hypothetical protein P7C70_g8846, partial [Phenoliferia sp. Uapishka_3]